MDPPRHAALELQFCGCSLRFSVMLGKRFLLEFKQRAFFYSFWCASALMGLW